MENEDENYDGSPETDLNNDITGESVIDKVIKNDWKELLKLRSLGQQVMRCHWKVLDS